MIAETKIKTCLWVPRYWPAMGGTELHTHELANHLAADFDVNIITHCVDSERVGVNIEQDVISANDASYTQGDVKVNRLTLNGNAKPLYNYIAGKHKINVIARPIYAGLFYNNLNERSFAITKHVDLIHFVYNGLTDSAILAMRNARKWKIPFIFTPNILDTSDQPHAWNSRRFKMLYAMAHQIIALTNHESEWLQRQGVPAQKISVVPYGPILNTGNNERKFREKLGLKTEKIVLFLGRINDYKGYDVLIESCNKLWLAHPDAHIVFMGPATQKARDKIKLVSDSRIILWEDFDQSLKSDALAECNVLCVPSQKESLGVVYIEAAFNSKPVVALDLPVLRDVIEHRVTGILAQNNANSIAESLIYLFDHPEDARAIGKKAFSVASERFNWAGVRDQITDIYQKAVFSFQEEQNSIRR